MRITRYRLVIIAGVGLAGTLAAATAVGGAPGTPSSSLSRPAADLSSLLPAGARPQDSPVKLTPQGGIPFPKSLDGQPGMRLRSGGPYVSTEDIRQKASSLLNCGSVSPLRKCDAIVVKFFPRYDDAVTSNAKNGAFGAGLASDREVYFVSVKGQLDMTARFHGPMTTGKDGGPLLVDHWNYQVDATTGDFVSGGTAGAVLEEAG